MNNKKLHERWDFVWIPSFSGMLRIVGLFSTDGLGLSIGPIFKGHAVQEGQFGPSRWDQ